LLRLRQAQALARQAAPRCARVATWRASACPPPDPHENELATGVPVLPDGQEHLRHGHDGQPCRL